MEWTKLPTNMLIQRFSDKEILAIAKYQLLWAELEEQPDEKTALRYMSRQQLAIALSFVCDIRGNVMRDVSQVQKKRTTEKMKYNKIKQNANFLPAESKQNADSMPEQIRLDKIREDNVPPKSPKGETLSPMKDDVLKEAIELWMAYKGERGQKYKPRGYEAMVNNLRTLSNNNPCIAMKIVKQSMANNWSGLFALKDGDFSKPVEQKTETIDDIIERMKREEQHEQAV